MRSLIRLTLFSRPYWRRIIITALSLIVITISNLFVPSLIRDVIDLGLVRGDTALVTSIGLVLIGIGAIRSALNFVQRYNAEWLSHRLDYDLRNALYERIQRLPFAFHDHSQTGQLLARCTEDVGNVQRFVGFALMDLINLVLLTVGITTILLATNVRLTLISLSPIPLLMLYAVRFGTRIAPYFTRINQSLARLSTILQETLAGVQVVKAFAREPGERSRFADSNHELYQHRLDTVRQWADAFPMMEMFIIFSTVLVIWFGGQEVLSGELTLGELAAFNAYVLLLAAPVQRLGFVVYIFGEASASSTRIFEVLDQPSVIRDAAEAVELPAIRGRVEFEHVTFAYERPDTLLRTDERENGAGMTRAALRDVSFVAHPDQVVALIGLTGSGKSTIINLIPRFYDTSSGTVRIDGTDVRDVTLKSLRSQIGIVLQESVLFSMSIQENIAFGRPDASRDDVIAAAKAAHAHDFIVKTPKGYDTVVGEKGITLSGGQRQRVAIARALLMEPRILILDDSTSSVDMRTEYEIQQALAELMQNRTTFVIAQRLSTIKRADQILVLGEGRIVQHGTHEELLRQGGLYGEIYDLQLRDQEELRRDMLQA